MEVSKHMKGDTDMKLDLRAIAERIKWDGADLSTPEAEAMAPVILQKTREFYNILTDHRITSAEGFRAAFGMMIAEAVMQGYNAGLASGKHQERERRRART